MRLRAIICLSVLAAATLSGCHTPAPVTPTADAEQTVPALSPERSSRAEALALFSQGLIDEHQRNPGSALTNFQQAVELEPDNEDLHIRLAIGLLQQKRFDDATALMENFVEGHPRAEKALLSLALIYRAADKTDKVISSYQRLLKLTPREQDVYVELAALYMRENRPREAIKLLEKASRRLEDPSAVLRLLGSIHIRQAMTATKPADARRSRRAATRTFEEALRLAPNDGTLLFQLGALCIEDGLLEKALDYYAAIEKLHPDNIQLRQKLAFSFITDKDRSLALRNLEQLAVKQPSNAYLLFYLAELQLDAGMVDQATVTLLKSVGASPLSAAPFIRLALIEMDRDREAAVRALENGLVRLPDHPRLVETLAYVHFLNKNYALAAASFERALQLAEKSGEAANPTLYFNYALASQAQGDLDKTAALLAKAYTNNAAHLESYLQYAFREKEDRVRHEAIQVLEKIGQAQPNQATVYVYIGLLNSYLKSFKTAIAAFEKAEALMEDSPRKEEVLNATYYFWYGAACEREGLFQRAESLFAKCLKLDPEYAEAYNYLAYMWAEKGMKLEQALDYVRSALRINPASGAYIDTLGWVYYMHGQYDDAKTQLSRAVEILPEDPTILEHMGDVLLKLGDEQQAIPRWEESFILDPTNEKLAAKLKEHGVDIEALRAEAEKRAKEPKPAPTTDDAATNDVDVEEDHPLILTEPLDPFGDEGMEEDEELAPIDEVPLPDEEFLDDEELPDEEPLDGQP